MLRWGLLGGERPPLPWEFFVALGGAVLGVCPVLLALLFPWWATYPILGLLELAVFVTAGAALLAAGADRRRAESRATLARPPPPPRQW
jgi:hypothetical protein